MMSHFHVVAELQRLCESEARLAHIKMCAMWFELLEVVHFCTAGGFTCLGLVPRHFDM